MNERNFALKQSVFTIKSNEALTASVYRMILTGDTSEITSPGQFVNLQLDGCFLRRPISVCDVNGNELVLIYKTVGKGTEKMSSLFPGKELDLLTGLGNGYDLSLSGTNPLLIGGGVGIPPLLYAAKILNKAGKTVHAVLGFNTAREIFLEEDFRALGCELIVATADGSNGVKGFVTDVLPSDCTYFYACGPEPMLRAIARTANLNGEMSFEARMGCGFGACMGCSMETVSGPKRVCKEGPVFKKEEILWNS